MKGHAEQAAVVPALRRGRQVQEERPVGRAGIVGEKIYLSLPTTYVETIGAGSGQQKSGISKIQVGKRLDDIERAERWLAGRQGIVKKRADGRARIQAVRPCRRGHRQDQDHKPGNEIDRCGSGLFQGQPR